MIKGFHYQLTTPKEVLDYQECRLDAEWTFLDIPVKERWEQKLEHDKFLLDRCGPDPHES